MWHCLLNKHQQNIFIGLKKSYISFIRFFSFFLIKDVTKFLFTPSILFFLPLRCLKMILNIPFIDSPAESFYGKTFIQTLNLHFRSSPIIHHQLPVIELLHILLHFLLILLLLLQCQGSFCVLLKHGGWCSRKWRCRRNAGRHWRVAITIGLSYWERCCYVFVHTVLYFSLISNANKYFIEENLHQFCYSSPFITSLFITNPISKSKYIKTQFKHVPSVL